MQQAEISKSLKRLPLLEEPTELEKKALNLALRFRSKLDGELELSEFWCSGVR